MPRNTRAAARGAGNNNTREEEDAAPETPQRQQAGERRAPLGDVTNTANTPLEEQRTIVLEVNLTKSAKKRKPGKGKKGRPGAGKKDGKTDSKPSDKENARPAIEICEDDNVSQTSSAVEEACEDLRRNGDKVSKSESPIRDGPRTPLSRAVQRTREKLDISRPQTPHFDPERHASPMSVKKSAFVSEDSFTQNISSRSPAKIFVEEEDISIQDAGMVQEGAASANNPSVTASSPSNKATVPTTPTRTRGDTRVAQLDALEDTLGQIHEDLQQNEIRMLAEPDSPVKSKKQGNESIDIMAAALAAAAVPELVNDSAPKPLATNDGISAKGMKIIPGAASAKPTMAKKKSTSTLRSASRPAGSGPASRSTTSTSTKSKPLTPRIASAGTISAAKPIYTAQNRRISSSKASTHPVTLAHRPKQRPSSISSKPPTVSTYQLPGEAVAAKLKSQKEERVKRMSLGAALAENKSASSQAPNYARKAVTVRETKASRARASVLPGSAAKATTLKSRSVTKPVAKPTNKPCPDVTSSITASTPTASTVGKASTVSKAAAAAARRAALNTTTTSKKPSTVKAPTAAKTKTLPTKAIASSKRISSTSTTATQVNGVLRSTLKSPIKSPSKLLAAFEPPADSVLSESLAPSASASAVGVATAVRRTSTVGHAPAGASSAAAAAAAANKSTVSSVARQTGAALLRARRAAEEERRAKEDASRKARAEAAERGRMASREWAAEKKARLDRERKTRVGDDVKGVEGAEIKIAEITEI